MPKTWTREQEKELISLMMRKDPVSVEALAKKYGRSPAAIRKKLERLGVNVVASKLEVTGHLDLPKELPSLEEVLKVVAAGIQKASQPGLGKVELQRLDTIAKLFKNDIRLPHSFIVAFPLPSNIHNSSSFFITIVSSVFLPSVNNIYT